MSELLEAGSTGMLLAGPGAGRVKSPGTRQALGAHSSALCQGLHACYPGTETWPLHCCCRVCDVSAAAVVGGGVCQEVLQVGCCRACTHASWASWSVCCGWEQQSSCLSSHLCPGLWLLCTLLYFCSLRAAYYCFVGWAVMLEVGHWRTATPPEGTSKWGPGLPCRPWHCSLVLSLVSAWGQTASPGCWSPHCACPLAAGTLQFQTPRHMLPCLQATRMGFHADDPGLLS